MSWSFLLHLSLIPLLIVVIVQNLKVSFRRPMNKAFGGEELGKHMARRTAVGNLHQGVH
jgi:hypothetical protein